MLAAFAIAAPFVHAGPVSGAAEGRQLYWVDPSPLIGGIWAGTADGSSPARKLYSTGKNPDGLAIDKAAKRIYFTNMTLLDSNSGNVQRGDLVNGKVANVIDLVPDGSGLKTPKQLVLDEVHRKVYFAEREGRRIYRVPMDGMKRPQDLEVLVDFTSRPDSENQFVGVQVDAARGEFYWSDRLTNTIWRARMDLWATVTPANAPYLATKVLSYSPTLGMICDLALDEKNRYMYWSDRGEGHELIGETLPAGSISRIALDVPNAPIEVLAGGLLKDPVGIALDVDSGKLFFGNTEDGKIFSLPINGGTPVQLHKSTLSAGLIFVNWAK